MGKRRVISPDKGEKIGRITQEQARKAGIKCADICITEGSIKHIAVGHRREIENAGLSVGDFIRFVAKNYNMIVEGSDSSIMIVVYRQQQGLHHTAALRLNYIGKENAWVVTTAGVRRTKDIEKRKVFWMDCQLSPL